MFDNLRNDSSASFYEEDDAEFFPEGPDEPEKPVKAKPRIYTESKFLGMTPLQRFIIAFMLMIAVCTLGTMCLLLTGKIGLL